MKTTLIVLGLMLSFVGCTQKNVDQSKICVYTNDDEAKKCKSGELSWFRPNIWGNEQLPMNAAGIYCDFNHEIMFNKTGVICVFTDKRLSLLN